MMVRELLMYILLIKTVLIKTVLSIFAKMYVMYYSLRYYKEETQVVKFLKETFFWVMAVSKELK